MQIRYYILFWIAGLYPLTTYAQCDRQKVIEDYQKGYLETIVGFSELEWSGDIDSCDAGTISDFSYQMTLDRINYYRRFVGLQTAVYFDTSLNAKAQEAALMMKSNNDLNHNPPESWKCYTEDGALAAKRSNLAIGTHSANAIALYINDPGVHNGPVGHRRWILYSRAHKFGMGSTNTTQALWVIAEKQDNPDVDYIAYPPAGYCPKPLVYPRWSFSKPGANFSMAKIKMIDPFGDPVSLEVLEEKKGFGDNTIVWEPDYPFEYLYDDIDYTYSVEIQDVVHKGDTINYAYDVIFIHPDRETPGCPEGLIWEAATCACNPIQTGSESISEVSTIRFYPNPFNQEINLSPLTTGDQVSIFSMDGRLIEAFRAQSALEKVYTDTWTPGIYVFHIQSGQKVFNKRLVKQ